MRMVDISVVNWLSDLLRRRLAVWIAVHKKFIGRNSLRIRNNMGIPLTPPQDEGRLLWDGP
jgi:hypothetical protein